MLSTAPENAAKSVAIKKRHQKGEEKNIKLGGGCASLQSVANYPLWVKSSVAAVYTPANHLKDQMNVTLFKKEKKWEKAELNVSDCAQVACFCCQESMFFLCWKCSCVPIDSMQWHGITRPITFTKIAPMMFFFSQFEKVHANLTRQVVPFSKSLGLI